ncbi:MAG: hypothetical protein MZW92_53390 [Comamonadaceae bacterium]|nr:hypothetical protein [Comamonadaceae bacterium]
MTDYIHGLGPEGRHLHVARPADVRGLLRVATQHEAQDAARFAEWGFDFLKYDWCSYGERRAEGSGSGAGAPAEAVSPHGRHPRAAAARHRLQPVPVRDGRGLEVGRRGRRALVADHGRPGPGEGPAAAGLLLDRVQERRARRVRAAGRAGTIPDYILIGYVGNAHSIDGPAEADRADAGTSSTPTCRCGR